MNLPDKTDRQGSPATIGPDDWPRVCVFGAGAVGCFHGARFAQAGAPVTLIGRPAHVDAIRAQGLRFDSGGVTCHIPIDASVEPGPVRDADLVLFCVKTRDTEAGARTIAPLLRPGAVVVSLQNGVDNADRLREAAGIDALAAVVYVATSMAGPGHLLHSGRGDLVIGEVLPGRSRERAARVAAWFERAGVPCPVSSDVRAALWTKLAMNCAFNAISALGRARYVRMIESLEVRATMRDLLEECAAVARAQGIALAEVDALYASAIALGEAMRQQTSSTAQDIAAGRPTEIDALNGLVARHGAALGVPTPVNRALHALVRLLETGDRTPG
ncbi:MAG: hypothetical protein RIS35_3680 [Pseudomonadota bacterium]